MANNNSRFVIGFEVHDADLLPHEKIPSTVLTGSQFHNDLKRTFNRLKEYEGLQCIKPQVIFKKIEAKTNEMADLINQIGENPKLLSRLRMILTESDIEIANVPTNEKGIFVVQGKNKTGYKNDPADGTKFRVGMRAGWISMFVFDYFAEIYIANSIPSISRFLSEKDNNLVKLYEEKDKFVKQEISKYSLPDRMGSGISQMSYASFFNVNRTNESLYNPDVIKETCLMWDRFVLENLSRFAAKNETIFQDIKSWKKVSGTLSESKVRNALLARGPGAYLLVKEKRSSQVRSTEKRGGRGISDQ